MYKGNETIKIKTFFDHETYGTTPRGATYVSCKYAHEFAEEFINRPDIEALDIKYSQKSICVIYRKRRNNMKYTVIAYAEGGLPRKEATITASGKVQAWQKAWKMFPEYHEVGVFKEQCPEGINVTALGPDRNAEFEAFKKKIAKGEK